MNKKLIPLIALGLCLLTPQAFAQNVNISTMFAAGTASFAAITKLVQYSSYLIGIFLVVGSIFKFSQLGTNPQMTAKTPIVMFLIGSCIFALTGSISVVSQTFSMGAVGPGNALMPAAAGLDASVSAAMTGVLTFIKMIGYVAFIRGWLMLNAAGQGKEGMINRGLTHLGGGVACINIPIFAKILAATFAPGVPLTMLGIS